MKLLFLLAGLLAFGHAADPEYNIFCHWDAQSYYRKGYSTFRSWNIAKELCTHLVYGSALRLDPEGSGALYISDERLNKDVLEDVLRLKNDKLMVLISIGGWKDDAQRFSKMVGNIHTRDQFYTSLIGFLYKWEFEGIHIDWEFPETKDAYHFIVFLKELKIILEDHKFLLMVSVSARLDAISLLTYDIHKIAKYADYISLITHNYNDPFGNHIDYTSPLYGTGNRSVQRAVAHWKRHSQAPAKLLLGVPLFGQTYTLEKANTSVLGSASKGPGLEHNNSRRPGFMTFGEFCKQASKWQRQYDKQAEVPSAYKDNQWISFEDGRSISAKMHLIKEQGLGGATVFSIDADDFNGNCGESFPLLRVIVSLIGDADALTTQAPTTEGIGLCPTDGFFRNPWYCQLYHECRDSKRTDYECIEGYYFDVALAECKPSKEVECSQNFTNWSPGQECYNFRNLPLNLRLME